MENGMEMISAKKDVSRVPSRKGQAPYTSSTGFHTLPHRYFAPSAFIDGMDWAIRVTRMPRTRTIMMSPMIIRVLLKTFSVRICRNDSRILLFAFAMASGEELITRSGRSLRVIIPFSIDDESIKVSVQLL